jgi:chorismate dehydratase
VIRCGRISYTNDLPVYAAFDAGAVAFPGTLISGVPTELNAKLLAGELDVSPISSFYYGQHAAEFVLMPDICIGSRREVRSIYCVSARPPSSLAGVPIAVTRESASGRALFATICATFYGFRPVYIESDDPFAAFAADGSPCIVIGDKGIDAYLSAPSGQAYDLGKLWRDHTGDEMVYAVWAARRDAANRDPAGVHAAAHALNAALTWGEQHRTAVIARAQQQIARPNGFYVEYYDALNFRFDPAAQAGLSAFFAAAAAAGLLEAAPPLEFLREVSSRV